MRHINIVIRHLWCVLTVTILIWENVDLRFKSKNISLSIRQVEVKRI